MTSKIHEKFRALAHMEHCELRDILFGLVIAFDKLDFINACKLNKSLQNHLGSHFRYEEETLHPFLEAIIGKVQVEHPNREHDTAIVDTSFLEQLLQSDNIGQKERRQGKKLVSRMLAHVSDCDGLAVMVELLPECQIESIISARDTAIKENILY